MYECPINIIMSDIETQFEQEVLKTVRRYDIVVDKDELVKALNYDRQQYEKGYADAKAEQQWISCSKRLPSENMEVLLTDTVWNRVIGRLIRTDEGYKWDVGEWWNDLEDWTAWMPLPDCYEGET